jgi:superfamily I DNA/RNA helicase
VRTLVLVADGNFNPEGGQHTMFHILAVRQPAQPNTCHCARKRCGVAESALDVGATGATAVRANGPCRLSGAAGTGKTVVLLHRARALAKADPDARVVVAAYTRNLASSLKDLLGHLDPTVPQVELGEPGVCVMGVDQLVAAVVKSASKEQIARACDEVLGARWSSSQQAGARKTSARWQAAVASARGLPAAATRGFLEAECATVVLPNRITTRERYLKVLRKGRKVPLSRKERGAVWSVVEGYRREGRADGVVDFDEAAALAVAVLQNPLAARADHVLVDEGQDLTPVKWQFVRALVSPGRDDIFIAEDAHQRIYGQKVVLGHFGINIVGRSCRLTLNYRTTQQNLDYGLTLLDGGAYTDMESGESVGAHGCLSARRGPSPELIPVASGEEETGVIIERLGSWLSAEGASPAGIAVLVRYGGARAALSDALNRVGIPTRVVEADSAPAKEAVAVMTMHRAKGLEFLRVVLTS